MKITSRKSRSPMSAHSGPNMTPMVDVVMCLIIFFMLCGTLVQACVERDGLTVPKAVNAPCELPLAPGGRLVINVAAGAAAEPEIIIRGTSLTSISDLTAYLRAAKNETPGMKVILRADQKLAYNWIAPVLTSCAQANIHSVHFSTRQD